MPESKLSNDADKGVLRRSFLKGIAVGGGAMIGFI
jgi:hypothetical protein